MRCLEERERGGQREGWMEDQGSRMKTGKLSENG